MGNTLKPSLVQQEELNWARDHSITVSEALKQRYLPSLQHFPVGSIAKLCSSRRSFLGMFYLHYYITNDTWTIEFGGGELANNTVEVHNRRVPEGGWEEKVFRITAEHKKRMEQVIGATGYSLCLRNCEHVARFIFSGSWYCMQMLPNGHLSKIFARYLMGEARKLSNQIPKELRLERDVHELYPGKEGVIKLINAKKQGFSSRDEKAFNVVFLGPTGSGKSSIINRLFNQNVCEEGSSAMSVTREICIYEGEATIRQRDGFTRRTVNIVDTIGFCDSSMSVKEAVDLTIDWLKVQSTTIDKVFVVVSGRIEAVHAESIRRILGWLRFKDHFSNFAFVYNKADTVGDEVTLQNNIGYMGDVLETGFKQLIPKHSPNVSWDLNFPLGIPPRASFEEMSKEMEMLVNILLVQTKRVPVSASECMIL